MEYYLINFNNENNNNIFIEGKNILTNEKVLIKDKINNLNINELNFLKYIKHKYILNLYEIIYDYNKKENKYYYSFIYEFFEGKLLKDKIIKYNNFNINNSFKIFSQILSFYFFLFKNKLYFEICENDYLLNNIFIDYEYNIKFFNFNNDNNQIINLIDCNNLDENKIVTNLIKILYLLLYGFPPDDYNYLNNKENKNLNELDIFFNNIFNNNNNNFENIFNFLKNYNFNYYECGINLIIYKFPFDMKIINFLEKNFYLNKNEIIFNLKQNYLNIYNSLYFQLVNKLKNNFKKSLSDFDSIENFLNDKKNQKKINIEDYEEKIKNLFTNKFIENNRILKELNNLIEIIENKSNYKSIIKKSQNLCSNEYDNNKYNKLNSFYKIIFNKNKDNSLKKKLNNSNCYNNNKDLKDFCINKNELNADTNYYEENKNLTNINSIKINSRNIYNNNLINNSINNNDNNIIIFKNKNNEYINDYVNNHNNSKTLIINSIIKKTLTPPLYKGYIEKEFISNFNNYEYLKQKIINNLIQNNINYKLINFWTFSTKHFNIEINILENLKFYYVINIKNKSEKIFNIKYVLQNICK